MTIPLRKKSEHHPMVGVAWGKKGDSFCGGKTARVSRERCTDGHAKDHNFRWYLHIHGFWEVLLVFSFFRWGVCFTTRPLIPRVFSATFYSLLGEGPVRYVYHTVCCIACFLMRFVCLRIFFVIYWNSEMWWSDVIGVMVILTGAHSIHRMSGNVAGHWRPSDPQ
jgi:hypothetical protein